MLEEKPDLTKHAGPLAGPGSALGGEVMALVHDQQVPRSMGRHAAPVGLRFSAGRLKELGQHVGHSEIVHRRDDSRERFPGVRVDAQAAAKLKGRFAVDDLEFEVELPTKLILPLALKHGRTEDQDPADSPPEQEFFKDESRLDRLTEANTVGQQ